MGAVEVKCLIPRVSLGSSQMFVVVILLGFKPRIVWCGVCGVVCGVMCVWCNVCGVRSCLILNSKFYRNLTKNHNFALFSPPKLHNRTHLLFM